jgi:transcriptional regulator with PAS, ATPase and Fis domain
MPTSPATDHTWVNEYPYAITVCDADGIIVEMNDAAARTFADDGGRALIGRNLIDCHPDRARTLVIDLLKTARPNIYTIQKNGKRKIIVQSPWYRSGLFSGIVELSIELPESIPHFNRDLTAPSSSEPK